VLFGSGEPYLIAIVSPAEAQVSRDSIMAHIKGVNETLPSDERVVKTFIAPEAFSIEAGLLTSQFKPKRKDIFKAFKNEIDRLYGVPR
jgi:long-subunit acyl-CoA synthetase (AMP-forming)